MADDERNKIMKEVRNELAVVAGEGGDPSSVMLALILVELRLLRRELGELGEWRSELGKDEPESQATCPGCGVPEGTYHKPQCPLLHNTVRAPVEPPVEDELSCARCDLPASRWDECRDDTCLARPGRFPVDYARRTAHHPFQPSDRDPEECANCRRPRHWHPAPARVSSPAKPPVELDPEPENARVDGADAAVRRATVVSAAEGYVDACERLWRLQALQAGLHPDEDPRKKLP